MSMLRGNQIILKIDIAVGMGTWWYLNIAHYLNILKIVYHKFKMIFYDQIFNSSKSFTEDLFHFSQKWKTLFSKIKPYFSWLSAMSIFEKQYFPFSMLISGHKSYYIWIPQAKSSRPPWHYPPQGFLLYSTLGKRILGAINQ